MRLLAYFMPGGDGYVIIKDSVPFHAIEIMTFMASSIYAVSSDPSLTSPGVSTHVTIKALQVQVSSPSHH